MLSCVLALAVAAPVGPTLAASGAVVQSQRLAEAKVRFEQLKADPRRSRYREGWDALLRELDGAARAAPKGPRAAEVALTTALVRAELYGASRAPADARAAFAALREVDEEHPGPLGLQALYAAVQLSWKTKHPGDRAAAAHRLVERYPDSAGAKAVAARTAELAGGSAAAPALPAGEVSPTSSAPDLPPALAAALAAAAAQAKHASAQVQRPAAVGVPPQTTPDADRGSTAAQPPSVEKVISVSGASSDERLGGPVARTAAAVREEVAAKGPAEAPPGRPRIAPARAAAPRQEADADDEADESGPPEPEASESPPSKSGPLLRAVKSAVAALTAPEDEPATAAKARELRSGALASGSSLAMQLGLKIRRIVVDAGHGGKDTGAIGPHGVREKDMALAIARKVAARLKGLGFAVLLTRHDDSFIALDDRTRIANEARADLFISIHCNAARRRKLEGVETWTLNVSADRYAARLAAFENAEADRSVGDLRLILADLATKANASDARELAQSVQSSVVRTLRSRALPVRDHGTKQALFYVLLGAHMPSILVETGFISNPAEEARLKSARFQDATAEAIARGVKDFVQSRRQLASVP
jgi:N-acetylmuramoyl-L-alanine amidase